MNETLPTIEIVSRKRRHKWDEDGIKRFAALTTTSGCGETWRTCLLCQTIRITVHPPHGLPWPEFILPGATARVALAMTPECQPKGEVETLTERGLS